MRWSDERIGRLVGPMALDLGGVEDPPALRVERVAAVHRAAIVPDDDVPCRPAVLVAKPRLRGMPPQFVQPRLGFLQRAAVDVCGVAPAEEQRVVARVGVGGYDRVTGAGRMSNV